MKKSVLVHVFLILLAACPAAAEVSVERVKLDSNLLGEQRPLNIVLPKGYSPDETWPVVFLLDGDTRDIARAADDMQAGHPRLIVVGIENTDRTRDMFPDPMEAKGGRGGGAEAFLRFLVDEVQPFVAKRYATNGIRVLCGQSNSGFFVLWAMAAEPDAYDAWVAISPMIGWDRDLIHDGVKRLFANRRSFPKALFMNEGAREHYRQVTGFMEGFTGLLEEIAPGDFTWTNQFVEDGGHIPPGSHRDGIAFVFDHGRRGVAEPARQN